MLHYGMQHAPVHDGLNESLSTTEAGSEADYSHWLQLSSPAESMSSVQGHSQASAQAFVQDAYNAQESVYYAQATQAPATPVFDAHDQYAYYVYTQEQQQSQQSHSEQHHHEAHDQQQEQDVQEQQEQRQQSHFPYLEDDQSGKDHMVAVQDGVYSIYSQYSAQEPQMQMPIFSSSSVERPPQPVTSQPPVLSASRSRGYPSSTNPLRPSRLRQVSNYEDDVADIPDDGAVTSSSRYDDHLASATLVSQPSESLTFALESPIKMEHVTSTSSLSHAFHGSVHPLSGTGSTDISVPDLHSATQSQPDSLYDALFNSADVAPIVTAHEEAPVENLWVADSDVVGSSAMDVDSLPAPTNFSASFAGSLSIDSALAGAVMDEFDTPEPLVSSLVGASDGATADTDADADGETETGSPLPPLMETSTSNASSASNALTSSTLVDDDCFVSPQTTQRQLVDSLGVVDVNIKGEHTVDCVPTGATDTERVNGTSKLVAAHVATHEIEESFSTAMPITPSPTDVSSQTLSLTAPLEVEPSAREAAAAADILLALAAPTRLPGNVPGSSSPVLFVAAVSHKRGASGKRKRGSATSSPARSRVSSPMPLPVTKQPRRRFFPGAPISFHIGPLDDVDPRTRLRHGTRGNKLVGIDAENQLEDKDRDHDLFIIRGGIFDLVPNGSRIKVAAQRSGSRAKGAENGGPGSTSTSRAGSVTGSSPAPGTGKANTRPKRGKGAVAPAAIQEAIPQGFQPPATPTQIGPSFERVKREASSNMIFEKPLFTTAPLEFAAKREGQDLLAGPPAVFTSATTYAIEPIAVPARSHASLQVTAAGSPLQSEPTVHRRQTVKKQPTTKPAKAKKRKRFEDDGDDDDFVDELENINHDGGYDDDYSAPPAFRGGPSVDGPSSKRPRRHVATPAAQTPPLPVPPRASAALPPIGTLPGTPSAESLRSFPSPLTPLTDLHSSSPPAPLPAQSPSTQMASGQSAISRPQTPAHTPVPVRMVTPFEHSQAMPASISPLSIVATSPQVPAHPSERSGPVAKRGPRRAPALPAFSNNEPQLAVPAESSMAAGSITGGEQDANVQPGEFAEFAAQPASGTAQPEFRTFPPGMELRPDRFPLWYRRYPVVAVFRPWDQLGDAVLGSPTRPKIPAGATFNNPTTVYDLYTPRYVKGTGREKQGMCPVCAEAPERGGEGKQYWFAMKVSAYNYHMQNAHGISASSKLPFSPPIEFRNVARPASGRHEKPSILEGKCHQCQKFIQLEGVKVGDIKVKEIYWWKHAAKCHQSTLSGECDLYYEDEVLSRVKAHEANERSTLLRAAVRQSPTATYAMPPSYPMVPSNASTSYIPTSPVTSLSNRGLPHNVHATQMPYAQAAISQYPVPMTIDDHGSSLNPTLSPGQSSYLILHGAQPHAPIPMSHMQQMSSIPADATATYPAVAHGLHPSAITASAADVAAAYVAATSGFPTISRPEVHMQ